MKNKPQTTKETAMNTETTISLDTQIEINNATHEYYKARVAVKTAIQALRNLGQDFGVYEDVDMNDTAVGLLQQTLKQLAYDEEHMVEMIKSLDA
jgi:hypothetical protein